MCDKFKEESTNKSHPIKSPLAQRIFLSNKHMVQGKGKALEIYPRTAGCWLVTTRIFIPFLGRGTQAKTLHFATLSPTPRPPKKIQELPLRISPEKTGNSQNGRGFKDIPKNSGRSHPQRIQLSVC